MLREEIIKGLKIATRKIGGCSDVGGWLDNDEALAIKSCEEAIKLLKGGTPQPNVDKIRAEIEKTTSRYTISRERGAMGQVEWSDRLIKESEVLEIIDKYKAESED